MSKRAYVVAGLACVLLIPVPATAVEPTIGVPIESAPAVSMQTALERPAHRLTRITTGLVASVSSTMAWRDGFIWPVKGAINTPFGGDHDGIDIEGETGDPIIATRAGRIVFAGDDGDGYGTKILIDHGRRVTSLYSHLSEMTVRRGWVDRGDKIGTVGCTGSCTGDHLHFEILRNKRALNPVDFLPGTKS